MNEAVYKQKIGKFILVSNFAIFGLIIILFALGGFDNEQIEELLQLLVPVKTVYTTAIVKYVIANRNADSTTDVEEQKITTLYKSTANMFVFGYIILVSVAIIGRGLFSIYGFDTMKYLITIIETFFGAYIGLIITDMFKTKDNTNQ